MRKLLILTLLCLSSIVYAEGGSPSGGSPALLLEDSSQDMGRIRTINFTGSGVSATASNNEAEVDFSGLSGYYLKLYQSPSQTVYGGAPNFSAGLDSGKRITLTGSADEVQLKVIANAVQTSDILQVLASDGTTEYLTYNSSTGLDLAYNDFVMSYEEAPGAPTVAILAEAGNLNGNYRYRITFVTPEGETSMGTESSQISPVNQKVNLSAIPTGTSRVTARKIYRTPVGAAWPYLSRLIDTINDNVTTTYTDNIAEGSLGAYAPGNNTTGANLFGNTIKIGEASSGVTLFGYQAGLVNTGSSNSFFGRDAGRSNSTGSSNSFFGRDAGRSNSTGSSNSFFGQGAGYTNSTGNSNSFFGRDAGRSNSTGGYNSFFGQGAGRYQADGTTALTDAENSVYLGYGTRGKDNSDNNSIVIGYNAIGLGANTCVLGNSSITATYLRGNTLIGTEDNDGTPATGKLVVKGSTNDGSTNIFVGRDSDEANVATLDTNGKLTLSDDLAVNGGDITATGDLTLDPAGNDVILDNANLQIQSTYQLQLRDSAIYINSANDGYLDLIADTGIRLNQNTTIGTGAAGVDYTLTFNGEDNDGVITWQEDEDTFAMACNLQLTDAGSKFGVGVAPSYPVHVQVRAQNAYCNYTDSQFSLSWLAPTIGLGSYLKNTGSESPVLGSHGMAVWGHYEDVASSQLMGIGTEGKVTAYGTGAIYGALVGYARFFNAGGTGPTGRIEGLHIKTEIAQSEGGTAINSGVGTGVYIEPIIGGAAATKYAFLGHNKVQVSASEGSTDTLYLNRTSSSADIVVEGNDNLTVTVPSGKSIFINDAAGAMAPSSSAGVDLGANGSEWGALYQKGPLVIAPSATQTIDAAGDTILANAGTVILDPGTVSNYTLTSAPTIADGYPGQKLTIIIATTSNKTVTIQDQDTLANSNIQLPWNNLSIGVRDVVTLVFNGADWCLAERQDN